jgi:hypothetical protein
VGAAASSGARARTGTRGSDVRIEAIAGVLVVACGACAGAWMVPRPGTSAATTAATGARPTHVVAVRAEALREEGARVVFAPEEVGERATRVRYVFARDELLRAAGSLRDVSLRVEQVRTEVRWQVPPTPGAGPTSGVRILEIECRIVGVE